jgi:hypothetical protein
VWWLVVQGEGQISTAVVVVVDGGGGGGSVVTHSLAVSSQKQPQLLLRSVLQDGWFGCGGVNTHARETS